MRNYREPAQILRSGLSFREGVVGPLVEDRGEDEIMI
jgi:hypothetical protein